MTPPRRRSSSSSYGRYRRRGTTGGPYPPAAASVSSRARVMRSRSDCVSTGSVRRVSAGSVRREPGLVRGERGRTARPIEDSNRRPYPRARQRRRRERRGRRPRGVNDARRRRIARRASARRRFLRVRIRSGVTVSGGPRGRSRCRGRSRPCHCGNRRLRPRDGRREAADRREAFRVARRVPFAATDPEFASDPTRPPPSSRSREERPPTTHPPR